MDLASKSVQRLKGANRQIKAIARAIVWTQAYGYPNMETEVRYQLAKELYDQGVRINKNTKHYKGDK